MLTKIVNKIFILIKVYSYFSFFICFLCCVEEGGVAENIENDVDTLKILRQKEIPGKFLDKIADMKIIHFLTSPYPTSIYMFKGNNKNTGRRCEICSKLTTEMPLALFWCLYC